MENRELLNVRHLCASVGDIPLLTDVSVRVPEGAIVGIVGESGCGKTTLVKSIMRAESPGVSVTQGEILFAGNDLLSLPSRKWDEIRGRDISVLFQNAMSALDPMMKVRRQVAEALRRHEKVSLREAEERAILWMKRVGLSDAEKRMNCYPHELSGGQCQRIGLAMAMINEPKLVIADEPTTALDVMTEAKILDLIKTLREEFHTSFLIVSHHIGTVSKLCDTVYVMVHGTITEQAGAEELIRRPAHPYSVALLRAYSSLRYTPDALYSIPGTVPPPGETVGCPFSGRCEKATEICRSRKPEEKRISDDHWVRCHEMTEVFCHD